MHILMNVNVYDYEKIAQQCGKQLIKSYPHLWIESCITEFLCIKGVFDDNTET